MEVKLTAKKIKYLIAGIWIFSLTIMTPWAIYYNEGKYVSSNSPVIPVCFQKWPSRKAMKAYFIGATLLCCYIIPLILIIVCYFFIGIKVWKRDQPGEKNASACVIYKSKVKVVKMLAVVVIMFAFSWMPLYVVHLVTFMNEPESSESSHLNIVNPIAQWLGSSNSGMNPFIYCFFSRKFRHGFRDLLICCRQRHVLHDSSTRAYICVKTHIEEPSTASYASKRSASPKIGSCSPRLTYSSRV